MTELNIRMHSQQWRKTLLPVEATLQHAIRNLDLTGMQINIVTTHDGIIVGTITDGDIRRGLLRGLDMNSPIGSVVNHESMVVPPHMTRDMVLHLMQANVISALPVVDESRRVIGLHLLNELLAPIYRSNMMVIMAGGRGARLLPHTQNCPKPMLPIGGKPMLEHIIERAKAEGFRHFVLSIHYLGQMIEDHFGDGSRWQVHIEYLREKYPMGTAGALSLINPRPELPFVVSNGDVLTDIKYAELLDFHCRHNSAATMAVRLHEWEHPYGVVRTSGVDIVGFEEKPITRSHINAGIYILEPDALDHLILNEHEDMPTLFSRLKDHSARTIVYPMHEPWLDVGRPDDLERAQTQHTINV